MSREIWIKEPETKAFCKEIDGIMFSLTTGFLNRMADGTQADIAEYYKTQGRLEAYRSISEALTKEEE